MKKLKQYAIVLCLAIFVTNCRVEPVEITAQNPAPASYHYEETEANGMKYGVFITVGKLTNGHHSGYGIHIVNLTKDKLEVEKLQRERGIF